MIEGIGSTQQANAANTESVQGLGQNRWLRPLGLLLLVPLAGALGWSVLFATQCEVDCGDAGGRGLFLLVLLCTPPAALGLLLLVATSRRRAGPGRGASSAAWWWHPWRSARSCSPAPRSLPAHEPRAPPRRGGPGLLVGEEDPYAYQEQQDKRAGIAWLVVALVLRA